MIGKTSQSIPIALINTIPAFDEPFSKILIGCVVRFPKTKSGNFYLLTIMFSAVRFSEAIPLKTINAQVFNGFWPTKTDSVGSRVKRCQEYFNKL